MVEENAATAPQFISMPPIMPTESANASHPKPETEPTKSLDSQSHLLSRLPPELVLCMSRADDTLLRLNRLLTTTAGLEYLLSTLNYCSYLLTFLHSRSPSHARFTLFLSRLLLRSRVLSVTTSKAPGRDTHSTTSKLVHITTLLTNTRTTLRLTALLPLYAWLRTLLSTPQNKPNPPDPYLHAIALTQCLSYILHQALENIAHMTDLQILPLSTTTSHYNPFRTSSLAPSTAKLWLISSRFWLAGVSCDILRLLREAYIEAQRRRRYARSTSTESELIGRIPTTTAAADEEGTHKRWWSELFVAGCWLPMCIHYSVEGGLFQPGIEDGMVGALGLAASWEGWKAAWAETKG